MSSSLKDIDFDILVVGGGHAGCEAAAASARMGVDTALISGDLKALARMSCNPAIGGIAKGHLVREIDALGGVMPHVTDRTAIQYRVLNRSKGYAVWSPRAQCDRSLYSQEMYKFMSGMLGLTLIEGNAVEIRLQADQTYEVILSNQEKIISLALILTCGTFLNGVLHFGDKIIKGGRIDEPPIEGVTESLNSLGIVSGRLKTGTPPRFDAETIDYSKVDRQDTDDDPIFFSHKTQDFHLPQKPCWITHTNSETHDLISTGLSRAPLYSGQINSIGPRYCPSIEDKIVRFADKPRHTIFLEPEGLTANLIYPNGLSTSLPEDVQEKAFRRIPGLKDVKFLAYGYAIEYDYFPPHQLKKTLETKIAPNLYLAGQINGTSGYEEAAAQGLAAGCNAALKIKGLNEKLTFERDEAYIGVMIDDLIAKGVDEPYRMFTSRAEYRLQLRLDNAYSRLSEKAHRFGLVDEEFINFVRSENEIIEETVKMLKNIRVKTNADESPTVFDLLRRPDYKFMDYFYLIDSAIKSQIEQSNRKSDLIKRIESEIKYSGYLKRQSLRAQDLKKYSKKTIPQDLDYKSIKGLSTEGMEKLQKIKPEDINQAANISGLTPADLAIILIHLKKLEKQSFHADLNNNVLA